MGYEGGFREEKGGEEGVSLPSSQVWCQKSRFDDDDVVGMIDLGRRVGQRFDTDSDECRPAGDNRRCTHGVRTITYRPQETSEAVLPTNLNQF